MVLAAALCGTAAQADFYVVGGPGPPVGTRITSLPYTISNPGFYYFGKNLTYTGSDNAITVNADDVTLDLMGFSLTKSGTPGTTSGIYMNGRSNVEIRNGTVRGFYVGVMEEYYGGKKHHVINVRARNNSGNGISLVGENHLVINCVSSDNGGWGIFLDTGVINKCNVSNNLNGIHLIYGIISKCIAVYNNDGITLNGPGSVLGNSAFHNYSRNFYLGVGGGNAIIVDRNSAYGLTTNYYVPPGTTGVQWGINAGTPSP
jgi:hypothetical protein